MNLKWSRENIWLLLISFTLCSFAFSERLNSWGVILLSIFFIADKNLLLKIKKPIQFKQVALFAGFFILYLIFYIFSDHGHDAYHSMFSKLTFLLLPLLLSYESYFTQDNEKKIILAFSVALSIGFLYAVGYSVYYYFFLNPHPILYDVINRMAISEGIMHPGYYSNYFMFGVLWHYFHKTKYQVFFISFFTLVLILLISRIVVLFYLLFLTYLAGMYIINAVRPLLTGTLFVIFSIVFCIGMYQIPTIQYRVDETINGINNTDQSVSYGAATSSRRIAYEHEIQLVVARPWWGYGLGNANNALQNKLNKDDYTILAANMHTHNQYFNTWMHTGILGMLWLCGLLIITSVSCFAQNKKLAAWFTILVAMNLLTDDMLEIQAGVVFFVLIWALLLFGREKAYESVNLYPTPRIL